MHSNTRLSGVLASCRIIILSITALYAQPAFSDEYGSIEATRAMAFPDIAYKDEHNQSHRLQNDLGKLTIVHFWATWCAPCVAELPELDAVQKKYASQGLKVISISEDGNNKIQTVKDFFAKNVITNLPSYLDIGTGGFKESNARGLPTSYFIDSKGLKIAIGEGPIHWKSAATVEFVTTQLKAAK